MKARIGLLMTAVMILVFLGSFRATRGGVVSRFHFRRWRHFLRFRLAAGRWTR